MSNQSMNEVGWKEFLRNWQDSLLLEFSKNPEAWEYMGLPDASTLSFCEPTPGRIVKLAESGKVSQENGIVRFYNVTDGWPLWLGEYCIEICSAAELDLFRNRSPDSFQIAVANAPDQRLVSSTGTLLSVKDFSEALMFSSPVDAREILLLLSDGTICFYQFSSTTLFSDFDYFMREMYNRVINEVKGTIEIYDSGWRKK